MKFIVPSGTILKKLSSISSVVPSSPMVPILENFLFEIEANVLNITASDLQNSVVVSMEVEAEENGSLAVPAKMLIDTLRNLPEQPVTFSFNLENYTIEISSENGRYKLAGENASDFPKLPDLGRVDKLEIPSDVLADAIHYTLFATSADEMKPSMNGVFLSLDSNGAHFVSTDTHRLIKYKREDLTSDFDTSIIVHKRALQILKTSLPSEREIVNIEFNPSNIIFSFSNYQLTSRLIDERFPDYEKAIPVDNDNVVTIDRQELINCLKRILIYANKTTNQVRLKLTGGELAVSAEDLDFSNEANERLFCEHHGGDIEIGFNAKFFLEVLNHIHTDKVLIKLSEPNVAGLVFPESQNQDEDILMLIMPFVLYNYA